MGFLPHTRGLSFQHGSGPRLLSEILKESVLDDGRGTGAKKANIHHETLQTHHRGHRLNEHEEKRRREEGGEKNGFEPPARSKMRQGGGGKS